MQVSKFAMFVMAPRKVWKGSCRTADSLPMGQVKRECQASLPIPAHTLAVEIKDKLSNERQLSGAQHVPPVRMPSKNL